jgi:hypothetical protein
VVQVEQTVERIFQVQQVTLLASAALLHSVVAKEVARAPIQRASDSAEHSRTVQQLLQPAEMAVAAAEEAAVVAAQEELVAMALVRLRVLRVLEHQSPLDQLLQFMARAEQVHQEALTS